MAEPVSVREPWLSSLFRRKRGAVDSQSSAECVHLGFGGSVTVSPPGPGETFAADLGVVAPEGPSAAVFLTATDCVDLSNVFRAMVDTSACNGQTDCPAARHLHGCFADHGNCDHPNEHRRASISQKASDA